jgi:hypothetical protein
MLATLLACGATAQAASFSVTVNGPDAIFLAGRTDVTIPEPALPWTGPAGGFLVRHTGPTPEEAKEQFPSFIAVSGGQIVRVLDPGVGGVNFFNGFGPPFFGPSGNGLGGSNLNALGGISGYIGPQGPLVGVFLDDGVPSAGPAPATLDFSAGGLGIDFASLSPLLRQVFYIGDGVTGGGDFQEFLAPTGATRLFFGIPDGFAFAGAPGFYDDNDGSYRIVVGIDEIPQIPEPSTYALMALGLGLLALARRRRA